MKSFVDIPGPRKLPVFGSALDMAWNTFRFDPLYAINSYYDRYGTIVRQRLAGRNEIWIYDPELCMQVFRQEGSWPHGMTSQIWPMNKYYRDKNMSQGIGGIGEEWYKFRMVVQKDMFAPKVAESYVPLIQESLKTSSETLPFATNRMMDFALFAITDMFFAIMLGYNPATVKCLDPSSVLYNKQDRDFAIKTKQCLSKVVRLMKSPFLNEETSATKTYKEFSLALDEILRESRIYLQEAATRSSTMAARTCLPYFTRLIERGEVTQQEAINMFSMILFAGSDTSATVFTWLLFNLARFPKAQEKLYNELRQEHPDKVLKSSALTAFLRESHRLTPPQYCLTFRKLDTDITLAGYLIPAGTRIVMCLSAIQLDPKYVVSAQEFDPGRWSPDQVKNRKGTPAEILDHKLLQKPFGFGSRMCVGSRIAEVMLRSIMAEICLKWKISFIESEPKWKRVQETMFVPMPFPTVKIEPR